MFKKPLGKLKTSAPLRNTDRRKLRSRISDAFGLSTEDADALVPDPILSAKFLTHLGEPGIAYFASDTGDPVWFTVGKESEELIPSVYTLFKRRTLLPILSTPSAVIPVLIGGADLMAPGVVQHPADLKQHQLVAITQYEPPGNKFGPPLAVGRMAVDVDGTTFRDSSENDGKKGKAVIVLHTWKDALWILGSSAKMELPPPEAIGDGGDVEESGLIDVTNDAENGVSEDGGQNVAGRATIPDTVTEDEPEEKAYTAQEVTSILRTALIQSIRTSLSTLPPSSFPMLSTTLYTAHILPSRPASLLTSLDSSLPRNIDIKHSSFKSLSSFLRACEKEGLVTLKSSKGGADAPVASVNSKHPDVVVHVVYGTLRDVEDKKGRREQGQERERIKVQEVGVKEMWKPWQESIEFFKEGGASPTALLTTLEIKSFINAYASSKNLVNSNDQQYINIGQDPILSSLLGPKAPKSKKASAVAVPEALAEFMKREEVVNKLVSKMQPWYEMTRPVTDEGKEPEVALMKGELKPIQVSIKARQGRKSSTHITNFEPWYIEPEVLAEELKKTCASSTSVSPIAGNKMEVQVQGKQITAVLEVLAAKGVPKKWIDAPKAKK